MRLKYEATVTRVWYQKGKEPLIETTGERKKKSFYGAVNLETGKVHTHTCEWETQEESVNFLKKIREIYPQQNIILLWDGAPWHKGDTVRQYLGETKNLELIRFPPYSPELNPQEHVWKNVRSHVSHNHELIDFKELVSKCEEYLSEMTFKSNFLEKYGLN